MAIQLVNLSGEGMNKRRTAPKKGPENIIAKEYRGLSPAQQARKAANISSCNGRCWWVYNYVYSELMYRRS